MKRVLYFAILASSLCFGQQSSLVLGPATSPTIGTGTNLQRSGVQYHQITWTVSGTIASCTVALDSSADGSSYSAGGVIAGQTCTSNGSSAVANSVVNNVRVNITTLTGGGNVTVVYGGYTTAPAGSLVNLATGVTGQLPISAVGSAGLSATAPATISAAGVIANGLVSVTNDAQTKAAIVPNTAPSAGQLLVGNVGGTAYAPVGLTGSGVTATLSGLGVLTLSAIPNATLSNSSITINTTAPVTGGATPSLGGSATIACATCATTTNGGALSGTSPVLVSAAGAISVSGVTGEQGNGSKLQLSTGTVTSNRVAKYDANGNTVNSSISDDALNVTFTEALFAIDGSGVAPGMSFATENGLGFARVSLNNLAYVSNGAVRILYSASEARHGSGLVIGISSNANPAAAGPDVGFSRGGAGIYDCGNGGFADVTCTFNAGTVNAGTALQQNGIQAALGSAAFLTSNYTNATTTFSNVTGLSFAVSASKNYKIRCDLDYQTSAATADVKIQWTGPSSPTAVTYDLVTEVTGSTLSAAVATAFSSSLSEAGTPTTATNFPMTITLTLINGANAGTVQLQAAATGVGTITIIPGACSLQQ